MAVHIEQRHFRTVQKSQSGLEPQPLSNGAPPVIRSVQILVARAAGYPPILGVGKANRPISPTAIHFYNLFPCVAPIRGRQQNPLAAPVGDGGFDVHPAVNGIEEENLGGRSPTDALGQNGEAFDCPTGAAVNCGGYVEAAYVGYEIIRLLRVLWPFVLERQQHPATEVVEKEHPGNLP